MKKWLIILYLIGFHLCIHAQAPYTWQLTDEDGLPNMEIYYLHQDNKGYMWLSTNGGLFKYNGRTFKPYRHFAQKENATSVIKEDSKGNIWYKNFSGQLFWIDPLEQIHLFELPDSVQVNPYFDFAIDKKKLRLASNQFYTYYFSDQSWQIDTVPNVPKHYTHTATNTPTKDQQGQYWYTTIFNELWLEADTAQLIGTIQAEEVYKVLPFSSDTVLLYNNNKVYIGDLNNICHLLPTDLLLQLDHPLVSFPIVLDKEIWITTRNGVYLFTKDSNQKWLLKLHLLKGKTVSSLDKDREGNIWLGTLGHGIYILPSTKIQYYNSTNSTLVHNKISTILSIDNILVVGQKSTLALLDIAKHKVNKIIPINDSREVTSIAYNDVSQELFFTITGLYQFDFPAFKKIKQYSYQSIIHGHHLAILPPTQLIVGSMVGSYSYSTKEEPTKHLLSEPYHSDWQYWDNNYTATPPIHTYNIKKTKTTSLWVDQQNSPSFWLGTIDTLFYYHTTQPIAILDGTKNIIASDIHQTPNGIIWVTTNNNGVYGIQNRKVTYHFTDKDGLPSNNCQTITTHKEWIWLGTNKGIVKLHYPSGKIDVYNQLDGLVTNDIHDIEIANNEVWAASNKGLINFSIHTNATNPIVPTIQIIDWSINDSSYTIQPNYQFSFDQNNLKFSFEAIALKSRGAFTYQYRLKGLDSTWISQFSENNLVRFQQLSFNDYRFEVRAINEDGMISEITAIDFRITPPYWETWSFRVFVFLIFGSLVAIIFSWRFKTMQHREATKNLINQLRLQALQSQMNPHFIFNAMSTIQSFWLHKPTREALIYHSKFGKLIRIIFEDSQKKKISLQKELEFVQIYIDLEKMRYKNKIEVVYNIPNHSNLQDIYIAPLIVQPIVENSFKHGFLHKTGNGILSIDIVVENSYIYFKIQDNGIGRNLAKKYNTLEYHPNRKSSMEITKNRLKILNETYGTIPNKALFRITDLPQDSGTCTEMWIPITNLYEDL